jgi:hypothetical protein
VHAHVHPGLALLQRKLLQGQPAQGGVRQQHRSRHVWRRSNVRFVGQLSEHAAAGGGAAHLIISCCC